MKKSPKSNAVTLNQEKRVYKIPNIIGYIEKLARFTTELVFFSFINEAIFDFILDVTDFNVIACDVAGYSLLNVYFCLCFF